MKKIMLAFLPDGALLRTPAIFPAVQVPEFLLRIAGYAASVAGQKLYPVR